MRSTFANFHMGPYAYFGPIFDDQLRDIRPVAELRYHTNFDIHWIAIGQEAHAVTVKLGQADAIQQ